MKKYVNNRYVEMTQLISLPFLTALSTADIYNLETRGDGYIGKG
jgi:hypothetical protein